jgi:hypothetical protein
MPVKQLPRPAHGEKDQHRRKQTAEIKMQAAQESHVRAVIQKPVNASELNLADASARLSETARPQPWLHDNLRP